MGTAGDEDREDERADVVDRLEPVGQPSTGVDTDRADEEGRQRDHDEHGEEGYEDHLDIGEMIFLSHLYSGARIAAMMSGGNTWEP